MKVIADQEIRVATLSGACVLLMPNVEREVSEEIGFLALQMGAKQVGELAPTVALTETVYTTAYDTQVSIQIIESEDVQPADDVMTGIEQLVTSANPDDFKADGTPKASALNRVVGRTVTTNEREAAWEAFINS